MNALLLLGTNLGDREHNIEYALSLLKSELGDIQAISKVIKTEAVGFEGPEFLNCVVSFDVRMDPLELLHCCKKIERSMGRTDPPEYDNDGNRVYHNRIIDIDILYFSDVVMDTPELTLPHPQVKTRPFVAELLSDTAIFHNFVCLPVGQ